MRVVTAPSMTRAQRLDTIAAIRKDGTVNVVVESPRGAQVKLKYDPELDAMTLVRPLPLGMVFPFDFGFVPRTRAEDGDPLDAMVLLDAPTFPGVVVASRPIAILRASQRGGRGRRVRNDRLVCIAEADRRSKELTDLADLPVRTRDELEAFFAAAVAFEGKDLALLGWGGRDEAREAIARGSRGSRTIRKNPAR